MRILLASLLLTAACSGAGSSTPATTAQSHDSLTKHQRDSVLGQSSIPGASGVSRALSAQDSGASRNRVVDSIAEAP